MNGRAGNSPDDRLGRVVRNRDTAQTAPPRCAAYAAWSELTASPHDLDARDALRARIGGFGGLPHAAGLDELLEDYLGFDTGGLKGQYSGLFEIGDDGPPVPIREDLHRGQRAGVREGLVRFYDYFGYGLDERFAWAPDHVSVELEFMHFLCFREASAVGDAMPFQLAQRDFSERHLNKWVPALAARVQDYAGDGIYVRVLAGLGDFIERDFIWQERTIVTTGTDRPG